MTKFQNMIALCDPVGTPFPWLDLRNLMPLDVKDRYQSESSSVLQVAPYRIPLNCMPFCHFDLNLALSPFWKSSQPPVVYLDILTSRLVKLHVISCDQLGYGQVNFGVRQTQSRAS